MALSRATDANLFHALVKNTLVLIVFKLGETIPPVSPPETEYCHRGNNIILIIFCPTQQLPCLGLGPMKGAVSAQKALTLPYTLFAKLPIYKETIRCVA